MPATGKTLSLRLITAHLNIIATCDYVAALRTLVASFLRLDIYVFFFTK